MASSDAPCSVAAGSQAHIQMLPFLFKPQPVAIVGFTYQEHGFCWQQAGHEVLVADGLESAEASARIVIVVNPNNPDGRVIEPEILATLGKKLGSKGGLLVVDEAFGDVVPESSTIAHAGQAGLLVLRSFGKFFGLAGLRLGFAFGPELLIERLSQRHGPWPASGAALEIGTKALADKPWINRSRKQLAAARKDLVKVLEQNSLNDVGGTDLFVLVQFERAGDLYEHLARRHILTRPFPGREDWLRFGVPATKPGLSRLADALSQFER
jgi:cobalamin biosynthetic protein CobC